MRAVIIDDDADARKAIKLVLEKFCPSVELLAEADGVQAGYHCLLKYQPDLAFLDMEMPDGTGIDLLKKFQQVPFKVIFVTGFQEYAIQAFKFSAIDYLLKSAAPRDIVDAVNRASKKLETERLHLQFKILMQNLEQPQQQTLILKTQEMMVAVKTSNIIRCESVGGYTNFVLADGREFLITKGLKEYEELLGAQNFMRIHKSHLINLNYFDSYLKKDEQVLLSNGEEVPLAARKKEAFLAHLSKFL